MNEYADWDYWMASYIGLWFVDCLARQSSFVIQADSGSCVWGRWYPVCVLRDLLSTTSVDQWDTPWRPLSLMH